MFRRLFSKKITIDTNREALLSGDSDDYDNNNQGLEDQDSKLELMKREMKKELMQLGDVSSDEKSQNQQNQHKTRLDALLSDYFQMGGKSDNLVLLLDSRQQLAFDKAIVAAQAEVNNANRLHIFSR